ncbi:MAG: chorismate synthase [Syntrophobacterales bacterium]|nr:MAG: chorismate synthase [Syntrophobacterales bacterium]
MNLILIGFMGVGKTSVGERLAERLGCPLIDTDALIEEVYSMTVAEIFEKYGEASFRKTEKAVVERVSKLRECVIATGGGVVLDRENIDRLKGHGLLIHLSLSPRAIYRRIGSEAKRPLLKTNNPRKILKALFQSREALYRAYSDFTVERNGMNVEETVERILEMVASCGAAGRFQHHLSRKGRIMSNHFGERFRIVTFGESHGKAMGVVVDGIKPGFDFDVEAIQKELDRRRPGQSHLVSPREEDDRVEVLSGVFEGKTLGTPICLLIPNKGYDPKAYDSLRDLFRPGHAGYTTLKKYGIRDYRGGGRHSGRETVARVAAGALAKRELEKEGIQIIAYTKEIDGIMAQRIDFDEIQRNPLRCPDREASKRMETKVLSYKTQGDSIGGIVEVIAHNVPPGLGDPVFGKLDSEIARALMSIGAVKAVEIGDGFEAARMRGSEHNDQMDRHGFKTNHAGGILGGISTGQEIRARIAVKPTPSIEKEQDTIDIFGHERRISIRGRHDPCICPRIVPVAEAMMALVLYDALLRQRDLEEKGDGLDQSRLEIEALDRRLIQLLAERNEISSRIGQYKEERGITIRDRTREKNLLDERLKWGKEAGVDAEIVKQIFHGILAESRKIQKQ